MITVVYPVPQQDHCVHVAPSLARGFVVSAGVALNLDALVTAAQAAPKLGVDRHVIYMWHAAGKIEQKPGKRYRWGDLLTVERDTRRNDPAGQRRSA